MKKSFAIEQRHIDILNFYSKEKHKTIKEILAECIEDYNEKNKKKKEIKHKPQTKDLVLFDQKALVQKEKSPGSQVWELYSQCYKEKYKVEPIRNAKTNALCSNLVKYVGLDTALDIVEFYLQINESFYIQQAHPLELCIKQYNRIYTMMTTGIQLSRKNASRVEIYENNERVFNKILKDLEEKK